jgi:hypothetical protein
MSGEQHIKASVALRGQGRFSDAIAEIETHLASFDDITLVPALLQALYAAKEMGNTQKARELAQQLAKHDPGLPSIQEFLP